MIDKLLIAVHASARHVLVSLSVDEILLLRYVNLRNNFRGLPLKVEVAPSSLKNVLCFIYVSVEANTSYSLLGAMQ